MTGGFRGYAASLQDAGGWVGCSWGFTPGGYTLSLWDKWGVARRVGRGRVLGEGLVGKGWQAHSVRAREL